MKVVKEPWQNTKVFADQSLYLGSIESDFRPIINWLKIKIKIKNKVAVCGAVCKTT